MWVSLYVFLLSAAGGLQGRQATYWPRSVAGAILEPGPLLRAIAQSAQLSAPLPRSPRLMCLGVAVERT